MARPRHAALAVGAVVCYAPAVTESAKELRNLSLVLAAHAKELRKAAAAARERGAVWREMAQKAREAAIASREQAGAARKRQDDR